MQINNLHYPLFKCSQRQCELLELALGCLAPEEDPYCSIFLCNALTFIAYSSKEYTLSEAHTLKGMVLASLGDHNFTLDYYMTYIAKGGDKYYLNAAKEIRCEMRKIWVRKLLEHNGYAYINSKS